MSSRGLGSADIPVGSGMDHGILGLSAILLRGIETAGFPRERASPSQSPRWERSPCPVFVIPALSNPTPTGSSPKSSPWQALLHGNKEKDPEVREWFSREKDVRDFGAVHGSGEVGPVYAPDLREAGERLARLKSASLDIGWPVGFDMPIRGVVERMERLLPLYRAANGS